MTDTTLKKCPIPGCGGEARMLGGRLPCGVFCSNESCVMSKHAVNSESWQTFYRPSAELGETVLQLRRKIQDMCTQHGIDQQDALFLFSCVSRIESLVAPETLDHVWVHVDYQDPVYVYQPTDPHVGQYRRAPVLRKTGAAPETQPREFTEAQKRIEQLERALREERAAAADNLNRAHRRIKQAETQPPYRWPGTIDGHMCGQCGRPGMRAERHSIDLVFCTNKDCAWMDVPFTPQSWVTVYGTPPETQQPCDESKLMRCVHCGVVLAYQGSESDGYEVESCDCKDKERCDACERPEPQQPGESVAEVVREMKGTADTGLSDTVQVERQALYDWIDRLSRASVTPGDAPPKVYLVDTDDGYSVYTNPINAAKAAQAHDGPTVVLPMLVHGAQPKQECTKQHTRDGLKCPGTCLELADRAEKAEAKLAESADDCEPCAKCNGTGEAGTTDDPLPCVCVMGARELIDEIATFVPEVEEHEAWRKLRQWTERDPDCEFCKQASLVERLGEQIRKLRKELDARRDSRKAIDCAEQERDELRRKLEGQKKRTKEMEELYLAAARRHNAARYGWTHEPQPESTNQDARHICMTCRRPRVTDDEAPLYAPGEGEHLCWARADETCDSPVEQDDDEPSGIPGGLPGCRDCGELPTGDILDSTNDVLAHTCDGSIWRGNRDQWLRHVAERTPCRVCRELPVLNKTEGDRCITHFHTHGSVPGFKSVGWYTPHEWIDGNRNEVNGPEATCVCGEIMVDGRCPLDPRPSNEVKDEPTCVNCVSDGMGGEQREECERCVDERVAPALERAREAMKWLSVHSADTPQQDFREAVLEHLEGEQKENMLGDLARSGLWKRVFARLDALEAAQKESNPALTASLLREHLKWHTSRGDE